jgi:hypothetical protein
MKSLKEFCSQMQWEFDYEVERNFGNLWDRSKKWRKL